MPVAVPITPTATPQIARLPDVIASAFAKTVIATATRILRANTIPRMSPGNSMMIAAPINVPTKIVGSSSVTSLRTTKLLPSPNINNERNKFTNSIGPGTQSRLINASSGAAIMPNPMPVEVWTRDAKTTKPLATKRDGSDCVSSNSSHPLSRLRGRIDRWEVGRVTPAAQSTERLGRFSQAVSSNSRARKLYRMILTAKAGHACPSVA